MPVPTTSSVFAIEVYVKASQIPRDVWGALERDEVGANCVLPSMIKAQSHEHSVRTPAPFGANQFWIVCRSGQDVDLVLSCTNNALDTYPIFIVDLRDLANGHLRPRLQGMADKLLSASHPERVYSVFAPHDIATTFAQVWSELAKIDIEQGGPYYAAKLSYCTTATFNESSLMHNLPGELRPARDEDTPCVAELCRQFASTSEPFVLNAEDAHREAQYLIRSKQVWVHTMPDGYNDDIASIVAFTRNSKNNATITKVYTNPRWRGAKCAQRLVARVCKELLFSQGKTTVALFVAHDNLAASKVYHNVGFAGLDESNDNPSLAPAWTEIGFDQAKVQLGHW